MKVSELLADESKWCQGAFARDAHAEVRASWHREANCWCLLGAVNKCYSDDLDENRNAKELLKSHIQNLHGHNDVSVFNDTATFDQVREVIMAADV